MTVHIIWAIALVLCFAIAVTPTIINDLNIRYNEDRFMTRESYDRLSGAVKQGLEDRKWYENSNHIDIDLILHHLHLRRGYKDGVLHLIADVQKSEWVDK